MGERINVNGQHMRWQQTKEPYAANVEVGRDYWDRVSVSVSNNGFGMRRNLSPDDAREMAGALVELADMADAYIAEHPEEDAGLRYFEHAREMYGSDKWFMKAVDAAERDYRKTASMHEGTDHE
jgi:hypothetical protein